MPKRVVRRRPYEVMIECLPLKPAHERRMRRIAVDGAADALREWDEAVEPLDRFYAAPQTVMAAFFVGKHERCREIAAECLALAREHEDDWNHGNAIHFAHTALGLLEVDAGNMANAIDHLRRSADIAGSPQLDTFGPSMMLARALLRQGQSVAVLAYFRQCRTFWKLGSTSLGIWEKKVARGETPTFAAQLYR